MSPLLIEGYNGHGNGLTKLAHLASNSATRRWCQRHLHGSYKHGKVIFLQPKSFDIFLKSAALGQSRKFKKTM